MNDMKNGDVKIRENAIFKRMEKLFIALIVFVSIAEFYHAWLDESTMSYRIATVFVLWIFFAIVLLISYLYVWVRARTEKSGIRESAIMWLLAIVVIAMVCATYLLIIQSPVAEEKFWQLIPFL